MIMRKLGINLAFTKTLPPEEIARLVASAGFNCVFVSHEPLMEENALSRYASLFEKNDLICESVHAPFKHINSIWRDNLDGETMLDELKKCVDNCHALSVPITVVHLSSGTTPPPITDVGRERFARFVDYASEHGVTPAFENQRMVANLAWALETFDSTVAGFCWDCGHEACFTPGRHYTPLFGDRLMYTHIHDNTGIFNDDRHYLPFEGVIDFSYVAGEIKRSGFGGTLTLECRMDSADSRSPEEFITDAARAITKIRQMVDGN